MGLPKKKSLSTWIHEAITDSDKESKLSQIVLMHMRVGKTEELHTWKPSVKGNNPIEVAAMFEDKAATFSQDLEGTQLFCLYAFYGKTSQPGAQHPFKVEVAAGLDGSNAGEMSSEPPNERGQIAQSMKVTNQVYARQQAMDGHSLRMHELQSRMIDQLMTDRFNAANIMIEMMVKQVDNNHAQRLAELNAQQSVNDRAALMKLAPALVNTFTGREVFPQASADTALIDSIAENLTEEHVSKLMQLDLPPSVTGPLMQRFMDARMKKQAEVETRKNLPPFRGSGEDDVVGGDNGSNGSNGGTHG